MDDLSSGLQFYSTLKHGFSILVLCCICSCVTFCYFNLLGKNYLQASNAQVTFKRVNSLNNIPAENCSINAPEYDCKFVDEYEAKNIKYAIPQSFVDPKRSPTVGSTTIFYENNSPQNYVKSFTNPSNIALVVLGVVIILIIAASINLYLIRTYKGYGAVVGGIEASRDVLSIFKSSKN